MESKNSWLTSKMSLRFRTKTKADARRHRLSN
ncbi:hypothetical protein BAMY6639_11055 [Bacillus amyloliquefaciens UMAF6639]|nr:hypothetical protein BAMY6639_11055 [Bacillus amyloliquefaciens UMAF6639]